MKQKLQVEV